MGKPNGWQILAAHAPPVHALLVRLTLHHDVADDLLHDLFVRLAGRIAASDNPAGYMHRTAINLAMDWRRARRPTTSRIDVPPTPASDPLTAAAAAEDVARVLDAAARLTELQRQAFALRFVEQHDYEDVGRLLGRDAHQARGLCHAAVSRLRAELRDDVPERR